MKRILLVVLVILTIILYGGYCMAEGEELEGYDFLYLFDGEVTLQQMPAESSIKRIAAYTFIERPDQNLLIDLEAGKFFYDRGYMYGYVLDADKQGDLSEELQQSIIDLTAKVNWPTCNASAGSDDIAWCIAIETDAGLVRYTSKGLDEQTNHEITDYLIDLYKIFWNSAE